METLYQCIIDDALMLECLNLPVSLLSLHMCLVLFRPNERTFVDIWVDLDIRVVAEIQSVLIGSYSVKRATFPTSMLSTRTYPFAIVHHLDEAVDIEKFGWGKQLG